MSDERVAQQEERISGRSLLKIFVAGIAIMAASIVASWLLLRAEIGPREAREQVRPRREVAGVEQTLVTRSARGRALRRAQAKALSEYGWLDESRGIVQIPIDRAMELRLRGLRP